MLSAYCSDNYKVFGSKSRFFRLNTQRKEPRAPMTRPETLPVMLPTQPERSFDPLEKPSSKR